MAASNKELYQQNLDRRMEEAGTVRKIVIIAISIILVLLLIGGLGTFIYFNSALKAMDEEDSSTQVVQIPMGSSTSDIGTILEDEGLIRSAFVFRLYVKFSNEADFRAGNFELSPSMSLQEILDTLADPEEGNSPSASAAIPEGSDLEETADILETELHLDRQEFLDTVNDPEYIEGLMSEYPDILTEDILNDEIIHPLEGYLFAATYNFTIEEPTIDSVIRMMLDKSREVISPYLESIEARDLTVHEAVTLASLVENEARSEDERKMIAGIFYNRLDENMMLQTDPTVLYALGEHKERVYYTDLEVESPYNTYQVEGLPPGPISNFSENSLEAVVNPEQSDYLYFIAGDDGSIYYAETYEEHQQLIDQYLHQDE